MIGTLLAANSAISGVLGGYNVGRFLAQKAIEKVKERRAKRAFESEVRSIYAKVKDVYLAVSDGVSPEEAAKFKALADAVAAKVAEVKAEVKKAA